MKHLTEKSHTENSKPCKFCISYPTPWNYETWESSVFPGSSPFHCSLCLFSVREQPPFLFNVTLKTRRKQLDRSSRPFLAKSKWWVYHVILFHIKSPLITVIFLKMYTTLCLPNVNYFLCLLQSLVDQRNISKGLMLLSIGCWTNSAEIS